MLYPGFIGGSFEAQSGTFDSQRTVNWYMEKAEGEGPSSRKALFPVPGVMSLGTPTGTGGPGRGHFYSDGREFAVVGHLLFEILENGVFTFRAGIPDTGDVVTFASNGDGGGELFITSGRDGYVYTLATDTLALVAAMVDKADMGDHLDGYFLALDSLTSTFYASALLDGTTWDTGTQFAQRSAAPDPWVAMKVLQRYVWLLGTQTSEVWYNSGAAFPFELHPSGLINYGCAAPRSVAVGDGALYWLGASKIGAGFVMRTTGFTPEVISTPALELAIGEYNKIDDAYGECYSELGHTFYVLSFPTQGITWVYDSRTGQWHERGTWVSERATYTSWRPRYHAFAFGQHRMLDAEGPSVYHLSRAYGTDVDDRPIRRLRRAPHLQQELQRIWYTAFELDLEPGLGLTTGQGSNPQVALRYSNDGGKTWGPEIWRSAGARGDYGKRVRWNRMGQARRRVFEVVVTDPIPWSLTNAYLEIERAQAQ